MSSNGFPHNVIRGAQQSIEMNRGVDIDQGGNPEDDSENESQNNRGMPS